MSKNHKGNHPDSDFSALKQFQIVPPDCEMCHRNIAMLNMYGYVYCKVVFDEEGRPVDFIHEEANAAYCKMTGISKIEGLKVSEVFPGFLDSNPGFMERHLNVAETGVADNFELYLESLGRWFDFAVISSEKKHFTAIIDDVTDRKLAEEVLKENEERFRAFFENHSAIKMLLDAENGNIVDANFAAAEFYGYPVDELRKMHIQQISTVTTEMLKSNLEKMRSSQQKTFAFIHRRVDGSLRNVELFTNKIEIKGKDFLYHVIHDVTERKQAEEALFKSEERFRKLFESYSAIQLVIDPDTGAIMDANPAAADYYGWSIEELHRMHIQDINICQLESLKKEFKTVTSSHTSKYLFRHRRADGSIRDVEVFSTRVEIEGKELLYSIINDITDRLETELALTQSEERFRSLFEDHAAVMIVLDPHTGSIVDANQAAADFYGWSVDKIRTMNINAVNTSSAETIREEMDKWNKMEQRSMAFRHRRADGSIRDVEIFAKKIRIAGRDLVYDIIHDVTLRKRLEQVNEFRLQILKKADSLSVEELLQETVDETERLTGSEIGFVFFVDEDQKSLFLQVVSTNTFQNMCKAEGKGQHYPLDKAGVWADAVRERKVVIHNDYASLKNRKGMPKGHAEIRRELVLPIIRNERIVAIMGIGNKPTDYDDNDIEWVDTLANQVWDIAAKKIAEEQEKILQGQLQLSKKMEMIGQLAAGLAHEINNPVNFITINVANLENNFDDVYELVSYYRKIIENIEKGYDVVDELRQLREKEKTLEIVT
ncbi:MAG: PAS domain S-box protein [Chlorobiales bacterium]|nr:PAS domain S-box protein [Chlorobiales bacterium]